MYISCLVPFLAESRQEDAPSGPHGVDAGALCDVDDDVDVGVVVVVRASGHLDVLVGHPNVVGVDLEVPGKTASHQHRVRRLMLRRQLSRPCGLAGLLRPRGGRAGGCSEGSEV